MITERCECCDLPVYSCGKAKETEQRRELARWRHQLLQRGWTLAVYPGTCARCGSWFEARACIRPLSDGLDFVRGWMAECCAGWIPAPHQGACRRCGKGFKPGAWIFLSGLVGWIAECCADGAR